MPCRATSVCRRAALTTQNPRQCLWITDEVLATAWNRYLRVSNAGDPGCARGRRNGSNVPGPLEAQRRQAKRRMGLATHAAVGMPAGIDVGALFSFGSTANNADEFAYQPPSVKHAKEGATSFDPLWMFRSAPKQDWDSFLDLQASPQDAVEASRAAFRNLLAARDDLDVVQACDLTDCLEFLQTAADESEARNSLHLTEWLASRRPTEDAIGALLCMLLEKVKLRTLDTDELSLIFVSLLEKEHDPMLVRPITNILEAMKRHNLENLCSSTVRHLLSRTTREVRPGERLERMVSLWLACMRGCRPLCSLDLSHRTWRATYDVLAAHVCDPACFAEHMCVLLHHDKLSDVLLHHWVPHLISVQDMDEPHVIVVGSAKVLQYPRTVDVTTEQLVQDFKVICRIRGKGHLRFKSAAALLALLHKHRIPYLRLARALFDITLQRDSPSDLYRLIRAIKMHQTVRLDVDLAAHLVHCYLSRKEVGYALTVFRMFPYLPLSRVFKLPIEIAREGRMPSQRIWTILQRQTPEDTITPADRPLPTPEMSLTPEHVDLLHLIAFAFADSPYLPARVAYRRVWECYIFLRDRRAPINALMTRAMVTSAVVRPLKELRRVSTMRLRYILALVERIEGREVADALDRMVCQIWQHDVLPKLRVRRAQTLLRDVYGGEHSLKDDMKAAHVRLNRWSREHRAWLFQHDQSRRGFKPTSEKPIVRHHQVADVPQPTTSTSDQTLLAPG